MEVKINREIRDFKENVYFGLDFRQLIFSMIACIVALGLYFLLKPYFSNETLSWICILGAIPFALMGFVKIDGYYFERYLKNWFEFYFLTPKTLMYRPTNYSYEMMKPYFDEIRRENLKTKKIDKSKLKKKRKRLRIKFTID